MGREILGRAFPKDESGEGTQPDTIDLRLVSLRAGGELLGV